MTVIEWHYTLSQSKDI